MLTCDPLRGRFGDCRRRAHLAPVQPAASRPSDPTLMRCCQRDCTARPCLPAGKAAARGCGCKCAATGAEASANLIGCWYRCGGGLQLLSLREDDTLNDTEVCGEKRGKRCVCVCVLSEHASMRRILYTTADVLGLRAGQRYETAEDRAARKSIAETDKFLEGTAPTLGSIGILVTMVVASA